MPRILESDAIALARNIDSMPENQRPKAASILQQYKEQQEADGLPHWPQLMADQEAETKRFRSMFADLSNVDSAAPAIAPVVKYAADPDEHRARVASTAFLATRYGKSADEVANGFELYAGDYAAKTWNEATPLDAKRFYARAKVEIQSEVDREDLTNSLGDAVTKAALLNDKTAWQAWKDSAATHPGWKPELEGQLFEAWRAADNKIKADMGDNAALIRRTVESLQSKTGVEGNAAEWTHPEYDLRELLITDPAGYKKTLRLIGRVATVAAKDNKEGVLGWFQKAGESLARGVEGIGEGFVADAQRGASAVAGVIGAEDTAKLNDASVRVARDLRDIANGVVDPVKRNNWLDTSIFGGLESMPGSMMRPINAALLMKGKYAGDAEKHFEEHGWTGAESKAAAQVIGIAAAAVESWSEMFGATKWGRAAMQAVGAGPNSKWITRFLGGLAPRAANEWGEEFIQDNLAAATQSMLNAVGASVGSPAPFMEEISGWVKTQGADTALVVLPLALLGAGLTTSREIGEAKAHALLGDVAQTAKVIGREAADRIAAIQDPAARAAEFQKVYQSQSAANRQEWLSASNELQKAKEEFAAATNTEAEAQALSITHDETGWRLNMADGGTVRVDSAQAAVSLRSDLMQARTEDEARALVSVVEDWQKSAPADTKRETNFTGEQVRLGSDGQLIGERAGGDVRVIDSPQLLRDIRSQAQSTGLGAEIDLVVNGSNSVFAQSVNEASRQIVQRLEINRSNEQAPIITVLHEQLEANLKAANIGGVVSTQETMSALARVADALPVADAQQRLASLERRKAPQSHIEEARREVDLRQRLQAVANGEGDEAAIREIAVELAVADVIARDKSGMKTGFRAGSVSAALDSAISKAVTPGEVRALGKFRAFLRSVRAWVRSVLGTVAGFQKARRDGKLTDGDAWSAWLDKVTGVTEQARYDQELADELKAIAGQDEAQYSGPGEGESFSLAPLASFTTKREREYSFGDGRYTHPVTLKNGTRLSGETFDFKWSDTDKMPTFFGYTKSGAEITLQAQYVTPDMVATSRDGNKSAENLRDRLTMWHSRRSRVTPAQDADYMRAVESGDMAKAQAMVDEAAKSSKGRLMITLLPRDMKEQLFNEYASFVNPEAKQVIFNTKKVPYGEMDIRGILVDDIPASQLQPMSATSKVPPLVIADGKLIDGQHRINSARQIGRTSLPYIDVTGLTDIDQAGFISTIPAVTRDESGQVIPLSQRFNPADDRITFSLSPSKQGASVGPMADENQAAQTPSSSPGGLTEAEAKQYEAGRNRFGDLHPDKAADLWEALANDGVAFEFEGTWVLANPELQGIPSQIAVYGKSKLSSRAEKAYATKLFKSDLVPSVEAGVAAIRRVPTIRVSEFEMDGLNHQAASLPGPFHGDIRKLQKWSVPESELDALRSAPNSLVRDEIMGRLLEVYEPPQLKDYSHLSAADFEEMVRERLPSMPVEKVKLAVASSMRSRGMDWSDLKGSEFDVVAAIVRPFVRHEMTAYDQLLRNGAPKDEARSLVLDNVEATIEQWSRPNNEAAKVSQGGFNKGSDSSPGSLLETTSKPMPEATMVGGQWPNDNSPSPPAVNSFDTSAPSLGASFSISPARNLELVQSAIDSQLSRDPDKRLKLAAKAMQKLEALRSRWMEEGWTALGHYKRPLVEKRSKASLDKEQSMRQGMALDRILSEKGYSSADANRSADSKDYEAWQRFQESKDLLLKSGLSDDEAEALAGNSSSTWRKNLVKAVRESITEAKAEVQTWRDEQDAMQSKDWNPRAALVRDLQLLDSVLSVLPPEVRAKVGGFVKLAQLATEDARVNELEKRVSKLDVVLERYLADEYRGQIKGLFDSASPNGSAGKKPKGKIGADEHEIFKLAEEASKLDGASVDGLVANLNNQIADERTPDERRDVLTKAREIVQLVGDMKHADSAQLEAAHNALASLYTNGLAEEKIRQAKIRERRAAFRVGMVEATGKDGTRKQRVEKEAEARKFAGLPIQSAADVFDFEQVLRYAFGDDSREARIFYTMEANASGVYLDSTHEVADKVEAFFVQLAGKGGLIGGESLPGEQLRWKMGNERAIDGGKAGPMTELEAIQALLMWQQEDGRRHMEGKHDESGKPTSSWSYDQAWIDSIKGQLSPQAQMVKSFIEKEYGSEYSTLNALYRERHGVNLPRHDRYAPITVKPMEAKSGEVVDPVTGSVAAGNGSLLTPGSLRTRSRSAVAEPDFRDALATMIAHKKQLAWWSAYYDLAVDLNATIGNREVVNAVEASSGRETAAVLKKWRDYYATGGFRDAASGLEINSMMGRAINRAAQVRLFGRLSTILVQITQLGAASVQMSPGAFMLRFGKLLSGQLSWGDAYRSDFIQRRLREAPPIVQQALARIGTTTSPNVLRAQVKRAGNLISGSDALWTAGTYAMILDHQRGQGAKIGLEGEELERFAHGEAERLTEQVAQPTRAARRSIFELSAGAPAMRSLWAFSSESRQKVAIGLFEAFNPRTKGFDKTKRVASAAALIWLVSGLVPALLKAALKSAKGDDDDWDLKKLAFRTASGPIGGLPFVDSIIDGRTMANVGYAPSAIKHLVTGNYEEITLSIRDVATVLQAAGMFHEDAAAAGVIANAVSDAADYIRFAATGKEKPKHKPTK